MYNFFAVSSKVSLELMKNLRRDPFTSIKKITKKELCFIVFIYATRRESKGTAQRLSKLDKSGAYRSSTIWYTLIFYAE